MDTWTTGTVEARRTASGPVGARGLLLTLLGEFVLPSDEPAWTAAVIDVLARLGVGEKAARQALRRTAHAGWLTAERSGRRTRWRLTAGGRTMLHEGAERIYSFTGAATDWDGRWLLVLARVPESDRHARHVLRTRLSWAGFAALAPGVWLSPHADREPEAVRVLHGAGVAKEAHVFVATRPGPSDASAMVRTAWDLDGVERHYRRFLAQFAETVGTVGTVGTESVGTVGTESAGTGTETAEAAGTGPRAPDPLADQIELVHAWRQFPSLDPALPRELLPAGWPGTRAARLFAELHGRWGEPARLAWRGLNSSG